MVPLKEVIDSGLWLKADCIADSSEEIKFQIRPLSFTKINLSEEVDDPFELKVIDIDSNVWLLKVEVVNLCPKDLSVEAVTKRLILVDDDNFQFTYVEDWHLSLSSEYAISSGLRKFFSGALPPKVRKRGSIAFELPDFYEELFISVKDGSLVEV